MEIRSLVRKLGLAGMIVSLCVQSPDDLWLTGWLCRIISSMAHQFQHYDAPPCFVFFGLLLGIQQRRDRSNGMPQCRDVAAGVAGWPRFFPLGCQRVIRKATANTFAPKVNLLVPESRGLCPVPTALPRGANHDFQRLYVAGMFLRKCSSSNHIIHLSQHRYPNKQPPTSTPLRGYIIRFLLSLFTMEGILHYMYVVAIKDRRAWVGYSPTEISMVGFWNLIIIWLKVRLHLDSKSPSPPSSELIWTRARTPLGLNRSQWWLTGAWVTTTTHSVLILLCSFFSPSDFWDVLLGTPTSCTTRLRSSGDYALSLEPIKRLFFRNSLQALIVSAHMIRLFLTLHSPFGSSIWLTKNYHVALDTLAILPAMGAPGWCWSSREHGAMYGKQLFNHGILEKLAQKL